jgi:KDO2-lipid IV(A) lauroyltransferase
MDKLEYILVKFFFSLFSHISINSGKRIAFALYLLVSRVVRYRRKVILDNLRLVYGAQLPAPENRLVNAIYKNFVYLWMEFLQNRRLGVEAIDDRFVLHNMDIVDEALQQGRGLILISGHFGNFEWLGQYLGLKGYKVSGIAKAQHNKQVNDLIVRNRTQFGVGVIYTTNAMQEGLAALARNEIIALVADQNARSKGVFVDFLGQPSSTAVGPAVFQMRSGAPMYLIISVRKEYGRFDVYFERIYEGPAREPAEKDILKITQLHSSALAKWVKQYPEQWFWMHKRWKTKPAPSSAYEVH